MLYAIWFYLVNINRMLFTESLIFQQQYSNFYVKFQVGLYEAEVADLHRAIFELSNADLDKHRFNATL